MIKPFANESDALTLGDLKVENRVDRISIYGSIDLTRDKVGLANAKTLQALLESAIAVMESKPLPERVEPSKPHSITNPFRA
jgi:hypothetical protein